MFIRPAEPADADSIATVHVRSWQAAYVGLMPQDHLDGLEPAMRLPLWERLLRESSLPRSGALVADVDGSVAGFAGFGPGRDDDVDPESVAEITTIYLLPEVWGAGVGGGLMNAALDVLASAGYERAALWVVDANTRARRFYERGGWRPDGAVQRDESDGFPLTEIRYRRPLSRLG
ncbi:GNAT family N-acetyltransferase [Planotetraspora kaengkrachanensis]|uniref:N-acetyltransferase n=1 Tax=Planotetraspora kaengkrachanensis TaxID=575193 RepID=A0A8J3V6C9_9ACTN|nr:GNAT family N-acetyltransferase [Planotetraspora kaengkrachanensis]GIG81565.1 N-acetyltransferase [Planotetraspora kaengkrachanensis]